MLNVPVLLHCFYTQTKKLTKHKTNLEIISLPDPRGKHRQGLHNMKEERVLSVLQSTVHSRCRDSMYLSTSSSLFGIIYGCYGGPALFWCLGFYFCFFFFLL